MRPPSAYRSLAAAVLAGLLALASAPAARAQAEESGLPGADEGAPTAAPERGGEAAAGEATAVRVVLDETLVERLVVATQEAGPDALRARIEARAAALEAALRARLPEPLWAFADELAAGRVSREARLGLLQLLGAIGVVLLTLRLLRGTGDVVVCIEFPAELRGAFRVRLSRRPVQGPRGGPSRRGGRRANRSSRSEHPMVSRETQFRGVPARRTFVSLEGVVKVARGEEVLSSHFEEQEIRVRRGGSVRVEFDLHPKDSPLDVKVLWDRRPAGEALVALRGVPGSTRYTRSAGVRMGVARGRHTVVVGSGDRVAQVEIDVESYKPTEVVVELTDRDRVLFTGCPPAVEPFLHGDVPAAARALERDGQHAVAHLLLARFHRERDQLETAARHFEQAGHPGAAADLYQSLSDFGRAADLYEQAGRSAEAAEAYRSAGDLSRAGLAFERAEQFDSAVECFRAAGDLDRWLSTLEKQGAFYEAAEAAIERADWPRAIRNLQLVKEDDPNFAEASRRLVDAYQREGQHELAARTLEGVVAAQGASQVSLELYDRLARLHESSGHYDRAVAALERIASRDESFPHLATRIDNLRKLVRSGAGAAAPDEAFDGGSRYEVLGEVGRGGMGVVYKARDRRLGRVVALKRLTENLRDHPRAVDLFLREARAAAALNHPNIVTLHDVGQEGGSYFITMELLEGHPLREILRRRGRLGARDVARLGIQIASALHYAHGQGIIHRDIKTANLFFTRGRVVKIMDFGLAKMVEEVRRGTTAIGGTPYYMAPEQSLGRKVDARADLYALGVTFFELATGKVPFLEGDVAFHHRHTPPPDPRERVEGLPTPWPSWCSR